MMKKKKEINGYQLTKFFYHTLDNNPDMLANCKSTHVSVFFRMLEIQNLVGWKVEVIGVPTEVTMHYSCVGNTRTYNRCIRDLIRWNIIEQVKKSVNQHQSRKITFHTEALFKFLGIEFAPVKTDQADDQATIKADNQPTTEAPVVPEPLYKTKETVINSSAFPKEEADDVKTVNCKPVSEKAYALLSAHRKDTIESYLFFCGIKDKDHFQTKGFIRYNSDKDLEKMEPTELGELLKKFANNVTDKSRDIADTKKINLKLSYVSNWIEGGRKPIGHDKELLGKEPSKMVYSHFSKSGNSIYLSGDSMDTLFSTLAQANNIDVDKVKFVLVQHFADHCKRIKTYNGLIQEFPKMLKKADGHD